MSTLCLALGLGVGIGFVSSQLGIADSAPPVKVDNLLRTELQVVDGVEVIISVVEIGPGSTLPRHYHPGEEFVYVLEGSASVWQQGKPDTLLRAGDALQIPFEQIHTAMTAEQPAKAVVFRVHRKGEPDRIPVN